MHESDFGSHDLRNVISSEPRVTPASMAGLPSHVSWWRHHPYLGALAGAGALLIIGTLVVIARSPATLSGTSGAWGDGSVTILNPSGTGGPSVQQETQYVPQQTVSYGYIPISSGAAQDADAPTRESFDFSAFMAELTRDDTAPSATRQGDTSLSTIETYSFIPKGFVAVGAPTGKRSATQQALFDYGNEAGSLVESFETAHRDQTQVLKNWIEDRHDAGKAAAVVQLGRALWETGRAMAALEAPAAAAAGGKALAESYMEIGANLALVPKAERDTDLLQAIETYNASADVFARHYIALVNLFGAHGVQFSASDPGSAFTFKPISL